MRLGVQGLLPHAPMVSAEDAAAVAAAGFGGISYMIVNPLVATQSEMEAVRDLLGAVGVQVAQANAQYNALVDPDETRRREGVRALQAACACWLGAETLYVRPGSLNPRGHWWPHPRNTAPSTVARLIGSLCEVAEIAVAEGVILALEGHVVSPLATPEQVREVFQPVEEMLLGYAGTEPPPDAW